MTKVYKYGGISFIVFGVLFVRNLSNVDPVFVKDTLQLLQRLRRDEVTQVCAAFRMNERHY